jgi:hypothetical protein
LLEGVLVEAARALDEALAPHLDRAVELSPIEHAAFC